MRALAALCGILLLLAGCSAAKPNRTGEDETMKQYYFPAEDARHEGTWLNWPHHYTYGTDYRDEIEPIWIAITAALHKGETVHIVVYDETERARVADRLAAARIGMGKIDFVLARTDDVWSRDTGPLFVLDGRGELAVAGFAFDGWGGKTPFENDSRLPRAVAEAKGIPLLEIPGLVLEGGSVELDGAGTAMLCKSSVVGESRNPDRTQAEAEAYLAQYFGVTNFLWLEGVAGEDITDGHIDGLARFYDSGTILTVPEQDFFELYERADERDYDALRRAKNAEGRPYAVVELPLTANEVGDLGYKGSYLNYYVGNEAVLLPVYRDANDEKAVRIMSGLYPDREIVPIDVTALFLYGGMLHCVTQQQPET